MTSLGGARTGAGRKRGVPNRSTAEIKAIAQEYGQAAIRRLAELAGLVKGKKSAQSEQAQIMALRELLDRGFGKATMNLDAKVGLDLSDIVLASLQQREESAP